MQIGVAYSEPIQQLWLRIEVPDDATVQAAIDQSGILKKFPDIDLANCVVPSLPIRPRFHAGAWRMRTTITETCLQKSSFIPTLESRKDFLATISL
jgi:hypothetical protein